MLERISIDNAISDFNNEDGLFYESENSDISDCDDDDTLKVVFAINVGKSHEGENIYQFFFSKCKYTYFLLNTLITEVIFANFYG